ncbi:MAG TPA: SpoIID/LytB domain-containing protein, partial [Jatrophihabitantaceae bacterium]
KGLTAAKIVAFYYPGTTLTTVSASTIRVRLSNVPANTTVFGGTSGLRLSGYGALPKSGYKYFRLVPSGKGLALQGRSTAWRTLKSGLAARADFSASTGWVQVLMADGTSTRYRGTVGAARSGSSELTVNRLALDRYVEGSVPREVPASWPSAAVRAQAIAARSYAESVRASAGSGSLYDICDNTMCQMYGGMAHYDKAGHLLWTDDPAALTGNANRVLRYHGGPVFAQYSASNGGATVAGGLPYLVGKADPYDTTASGDPYLNRSTAVRASRIAGYYGLKSVTSVQITARDGHGPWHGRVVSAYVNGTTSAGKSAHLATTGAALGAATGVGSSYLRLATTATAPAAPTGLKAAAGDAGATISWAAPTNTGNLPITGYRLGFAGHTRTVSAAARSAWVGPLSNLGAASVTVQAVNAAGASGAARVAVGPRAAPRPIVVVPSRRVLATTVRAGHPYVFSAPGHGSIPARGAASGQFVLTVRAPTRSGKLTVAPVGVSTSSATALAYRARRVSTTTVSLPFQPSGSIRFAPSAGSLRLTLDQQSYTAATGSRVTVVPRRTIANLAAVPTGTGRSVRVAGLSGAAKAVLVAVDARSTRSTTLRLWPDGQSRPAGQQVTLSTVSSNTNAVIVPLGRSHRLRIASGKPGAHARVTLLGVVGASGGRLETFPAARVTTAVVGTRASSLTVAGRAQVPTSGVAAVLVQITVRSPGSSGALWAYQAGARHQKPRVIMFPSSGSTTAVALVALTDHRTIRLHSNTSGVHASIATIGYVTTS